MHIVIHCNGGTAVGMGHVVRSLALAEEAVASGHDVTLIGDLSGDFVLHLLEEAPVAVRRLSRNSQSQVVSALWEIRPDVLHFDTYDSVDTILGGTGPGILTSNMEDNGFGRRRADLVIDPTFGADLQPGMSHSNLTSLRGSRYAPLRRGVLTHRGDWRLREVATRVLVVMGGFDPMELTPRVLEALAATGLSLHVTAITARPRQVTGQVQGNMVVEFIPPAANLPALMTHQDLVVSAAGTTTWELCCLGIPTALVCTVDNQRSGYERVVSAGAAVGLPHHLRADAAIAATDQLRHVLIDSTCRRRLSQKAARLVDGLGARRIVRVWEELASS